MENLGLKGGGDIRDGQRGEKGDKKGVKIFFFPFLTKA